MPAKNECEPNIFCYYDVTASAQDDDIKKKIQQFWPGNHEEITPGNEEQPTPGDNITSILVVHRRPWEKLSKVSKGKCKEAISIFCKKANEDTLFVVFTRGWDNFSSREKWCEEYAEGISQDRVCILLDTEFLKVLPEMSQYLKETPLSKWRIDGFYKPYTLKPQLTAISILCQGFLMRLQLSPIENEKDEKKEIYKKAFSKVFGNENADIIIKNVKKEWESLSSKTDFNDVKFKAVESFIMAASSGNPKLDTSVIKNAYLALNERLGAASG